MSVCYVTRRANYIPACGRSLTAALGVAGTNSLKEVTCPGCLRSDDYLATSMERALTKAGILEEAAALQSLMGTDMYGR